MKIAADTNVLLCLVVDDNEVQSALAIAAMENASVVAISVHVLCELAWVLDRLYAVPRSDVAETIQGLIEGNNVVVNRAAVDAGLSVLNAGGDLADGVSI